MAAFPDGTEGQQVFHSVLSAVFTFVGERWTTPGGAVYPAGVGVAARSAVVLVDGTLEALDTSTHDHATGVVTAVSDDGALVRWEGEVEGYEGLAPNAACCGSGEPGLLTQNPNPGLNLIVLGYATSESRLTLTLTTPVLS